MAKSETEALQPASLISENDHPDFVDGAVGEQESGADPKSIDSAPPGSAPQSASGFFPWPIRFCGPVSGKYRLRQRPIRLPIPSVPPIPAPGTPAPIPVPGPVFPVNLTWVTARIDVDRFNPQHRISIEARRLFPSQHSHVIAEVDSDACVGFNHRVIEATITYRDGVASMIPGTRVRFTARRTSGFAYGDYSVELLDGTTVVRRYDVDFVSKFFDPVELEVDRASNAGTPVTTYNTGSHPNRPANLPNEVLSLESVFERAGFDARMSPNSTVIPANDAGANGTWSDSELHNAMAIYWSRFANRPQWAMWVFYAERHDDGRGLGGVMFDDIGPRHRQGTSVFRDSFIQDAPAGDPDPADWRRRMEFWTGVHEIGHGFNLAHSWQKSMSLPGGDGPWIPLANEPEARSFMNYPDRVKGKQQSFFSDFRFRFSDDELVFMRHAPRRFVQMGNETWFDNHGFEAPDELLQTGRWSLEIRPNRDGASYQFLEPVSMELKLTNTAGADTVVDADLLRHGHHMKVFVGRAGGRTQAWRPMQSHFEKDEPTTLEPGESLYGAHLVSMSTQGWLIDEPGFYKVQAAIDMGDEIIVSNVMRVYVAPPGSVDEADLADRYFTEEVGRAINYMGAPSFTDAHATLEELIERCGDNPAACHAELAVTSPGLRRYKSLTVGSAGKEDMRITAARAAVSSSAARQQTVLLDDPDGAADTIGHIRYFDHLRHLDEVLQEDGDNDGSNQVLARSIEVMRSRGVLDRVVDNAQRRLRRRESK